MQTAAAVADFRTYPKICDLAGAQVRDDQIRVQWADGRFIAMTREDRFRLVKRLNPGELWCFDNRRTLHARNAFDPTSGARHFQGCYIDRDELLSRILVLQR